MQLLGDAGLCSKRTPCSWLAVGGAGSGLAQAQSPPARLMTPVTFLSLWLRNFSLFLDLGDGSPGWAATVKGKGHLSRGSPEASLGPASKGTIGSGSLGPAVVTPASP